MKVLLGQLGSNGDCLYATTLARQIKTDFPGCHLTWGISSLAQRVIDNNPDIDEIWEVPLQSWAEMEVGWNEFEREALRRHSRGEFQQIFLTQISPNNFATYDGTIRPSMFRNYPKPITVPVETNIRLTLEEIEKVDAWFKSSAASDAGFVVLFECSSKSGQSAVTPALALQVAELVVAQEPDVAVILSTHEPLSPSHPRIVLGGELSMRETARLTHHTDLFVGCGSGLTVVATSNAAKPHLPNIQLLSKASSVYASFMHDFEYFKKPAGHFLESTVEDAATIAEIILAARRDGLATAKLRFHKPAPLDFTWYLKLIDLMLLQRGHYLDAARSVQITAERYGWHPQLRTFTRRYLIPLMPHDRLAKERHRQAEIEGFHTAFAGAARSA